jgi:hypothetical protein
MYRAAMLALLLWLAGPSCGGGSEVPATRDTVVDSGPDTNSDTDSGGGDVIASDTGPAPEDSNGGDASMDAGDTDPCGQTASASCVTVSGTCEANGGSCFDLEVVGSQFDAYDGQLARVVTNAFGIDLSDVGTVVGVSEVKIVGGAFALSMPQTLTGYSGISLYIDHNCSSTCDVGEPMWGITTGVTATFDSPYLVELTSSDLSAFDAPASDWVGGCVNNGSDLATYLPCQP